MPATDTFTLAGKRIWVAGHRGMVGSALVRRLATEECSVITAERSQLDLTRQRETEEWVADNKLDAIILAAAKVGGILENDTHPVDFLESNLLIETNVISASYATRVEKLLFLGSSCVYPKLAPQPLKEDSLLTGPLEPTNEWYAVAKIAGIKLCQAYRKQYGANYISAMPTNLYGPEDNFDLQSSHVLPALIRKTHEAKQQGSKELVVWGTGNARREFLHVDDCAAALVHLLVNYSGIEHVNIGIGSDIDIRSLVGLVAEIIGYSGHITFDLSKPDGTPRKLMNVDKLIETGFNAKIDLMTGIQATYTWFLANSDQARTGTHALSSTRPSQAAMPSLNPKSPTRNVR